MVPTQRQRSCPSWCALRHGEHAGEEDTVHVSKPVFVRNMLIRLCATLDPDTGAQDGPYVLVGNEELRLDEATELVDVLTTLLQRAGTVTPRAAV